MKELVLFRFFALFPFIGMIAPDITDALHSSFSTITAEHIIVEITLLICLLLCTAGIWFFEINKLKNMVPKVPEPGVL
jgi:hypothetical protein